MASERTYVVVRRDPSDGRSPLEAVNLVNAALAPRSGGSLALRAAPIPGLERWIEPLTEIACGVIALRLTVMEAEIFAGEFQELQVSEEVYLSLADGWSHEDEFLDARLPTPHWTIGFEVKNAAGDPIEGAKVIARIPGLSGAIVKRTNGSGVAYLHVSRSDASFLIRPAHSYWDRNVGVLEPSQFLQTITVNLESLQLAAGYQWDLRASEMAEVRRDVSADAPRIALIDTGIGDHPNLPEEIRRKNFTSGEPPDSENKDPRGHGTTLAGIIAAGRDIGAMRGYLPHAHIWDYRAVPAIGAASEIAVAKAITEAAQDGADIICLALAVPRGSREPLAVREALRIAGQHGVACAISAGNHGGAVSFPAAYNFGHCLSVGAYGRRDFIPANTTHEEAILEYPASSGFFLAAFGNRAQGTGRIDVLAPGVACPTTVAGGYAAVSGTSIAAAHAAGIMGVLLDRHPDLRDLPPREKAEALVARARRLARPFHWGRNFEGEGRMFVG